MDKSLFINMSGAKNASRQLEIITNNLANINTTGFRADSTYLEQHQAAQKGNQSRVYAKLNSTFTDFKQGPIVNTGRDLDVAVNGEGFIAVQSKNGQEAYTRVGALQVKNGVLMQNGNLVLGSAGVVSIPDAQRLNIAPDGTVSALFVGESQLTPIDKIKLVKPPVNQLNKGQDGLFYLNGDGTAQADPDVTIMAGALESSNVNAIETMTQLIDLTRNYQIHTNFMKTILDDTAKANQLLELVR